MPHIDNASGRTPGCPHKHDYFGIEPARSDEPRLTIVKTVVWARQVQASKNLFDPAHVQAPRLQRVQALGWIAGDAHGLSVATFNARVNLTVKATECCLTLRMSAARTHA
jgi:hypothetical protein